MCYSFSMTFTERRMKHFERIADFSIAPLTASERYGFGDLAIGESIAITPTENETIVKVRGHIGAHGQYYKKKFKTKTVNGKLYVLRIA